MKGLQILKVEIHNYRQYQDTHTIELDCSDDAMNNVIEGENGAGKSNLLNAVTFCFFGIEDHKENNVDDDDAELPYINKNIMERLDSDESAEGYIEIELGTDSPEYIFRREFASFKITNNEFENVFEELTILKQSGTDWEEVETPERTRNEILPPNVRDYFIFDAESLRDFFGPNYQQRIRKGILDVSHIELLDSGLNHLENTRSTIESNASDASDRLSELQDEIDAKEADIDDLEDEIESFGEDIEDTRKELSQTKSKMQDASDERVQDLYDTRERLEGLLSERRQERDNRIDEINELIVEAGPIVYANQALEKSQDILKELDLPPDIRKDFLEELIDDKKCICGEDLEDKPQKLEELQALKVDVERVNESTIEGEYEVESIIEKQSDLVSELRSKRSKKSELDGKIEKINQNLNETSEKLKKFDIPDDVDVAALEEQRNELIEQRDTLIKKQGKKEVQLESEEKELKKLRQEFNDELAKQQEYRKVVSRLDFIDDVIDKLESIRTTVLSQIREQVVGQMNTYYNQLIWKDTEYTIELNEDYQIAVLNEQDQNQLGSLSAGETQVLALSFLSALSQISGFRAPILIDTPLARISGQPKKHIASHLPEYLSDTQVTFLMTDEEYSSEVEGLLKNQVSNEYELDFYDGSTEVTAR
jgi:DNA sulfur modification protein DndD